MNRRLIGFTESVQCKKYAFEFSVAVRSIVASHWIRLTAMPSRFSWVPDVPVGAGRVGYLVVTRPICNGLRNAASADLHECYECQSCPVTSFQRHPLGVNANGEQMGSGTCLRSF